MMRLTALETSLVRILLDGPAEATELCHQLGINRESLRHHISIVRKKLPRGGVHRSTYYELTPQAVAELAP